MLNSIDTQKGTNTMSKNYVRIWEQYNNEKLSDELEIHHVDGNHDNNDPENLKAVTIEEHLSIHEDQNDYGACQAILMRMERTEETILKIRNAASKHQLQLLEKGEHNFQKMSPERRSQRSSRAGKKTRDLKIGIHAINADPIKAKENARRAGSVAAEKCAGFLDTNSKNHGSKHVKNTSWWINEDGNRKRSKESPGDNWQKGMTWKSN